MEANGFLGGKSVVVTVEDECQSCADSDLDMSPAAFSKLAPLSVGVYLSFVREADNVGFQLHGNLSRFLVSSIYIDTRKSRNEVVSNLSIGFMT